MGGGGVGRWGVGVWGVGGGRAGCVWGVVSGVGGWVGGGGGGGSGGRGRVPIMHLSGSPFQKEFAGSNILHVGFVFILRFLICDPLSVPVF